MKEHGDELHTFRVFSSWGWGSDMSAAAEQEHFCFCFVGRRPLTGAILEASELSLLPELPGRRTNV